MLKKTIKYVDYNGEQREEDFYFNLSKAELMEMEFSKDGGLTNSIERIIKEKNEKELVRIFKDLVLNAYGVKSDDGKRFIKNKEIRESFAQTEAYSELFMELAADDEAAAAFVNGIVPAVSKQPLPPHPANKN